MSVIGASFWLVVAAAFADGTASPTSATAAGMIEIDARGPWRADGPGLKELKPATDDPRQLTAAIAEAGGGTTLVRFCPAAIADLSRRWPLALAAPFEVVAELRGDVRAGEDRPTWALFWKDALWRFHKTAAQPADGPCRLSLPADGVNDLVEIGVLLYCPARTRAAGGTAVIRVERLALRTGVTHDPPLPPEGGRIETLGPGHRWQPDDACPGVTSVEHKGGCALLNCTLDSQDRKRRYGGVWIDVAGDSGAADFSGRGVFVTLRAPAGFACRHNTGCSFGVGLRDADGNVFWSGERGIVAADEPTTKGLYPEMRFPLPLTFCSERFDPRRVTTVGIRLRIEDRGKAMFAGAVTVDDVRIVTMPEELRARRDAIAERIGRENWLNAIASRRAKRPSEPVPITEFIQNVGVDFPWPKDVYPSVGRRTWDASRGGFSSCKDALAADFEYLAAHRVRMIRVFIFGDGLTGIAEDDRGRIALDPMALPDIRALLEAVEPFKSLRLVPVLFDFHIADGVEREGLAVVGEHPAWITDAAKRAELFEAVGPAIDLLCSHPQVAFIDLMNEPEHTVAVGMDDVRAFIAELAARVHRHSRRAACTVGSATAICAPFWLSTGIDFPTSHWFEKIDPSHSLGQLSAALDPSTCTMTEVDPGVDVAESLTTLWRAGFRGAWFWSLNAGDEYEFRGKPAEALRQWVETHGQ